MTQSDSTSTSNSSSIRSSHPTYPSTLAGLKCAEGYDNDHCNDDTNDQFFHLNLDDDDLIQKQIAILENIQQERERTQNMKPPPPLARSHDLQHNPDHIAPNIQETTRTVPQSEVFSTLTSTAAAAGTAAVSDLDNLDGGVDDFTDFLNDPQLIRAQRRILESFQQQQEQSQPFSVIRSGQSGSNFGRSSRRDQNFTLGDMGSRDMHSYQSPEPQVPVVSPSSNHSTVSESTLSTASSRQHLDRITESAHRAVSIQTKTMMLMRQQRPSHSSLELSNSLASSNDQVAYQKTVSSNNIKSRDSRHDHHYYLHDNIVTSSGDRISKLSNGKKIKVMGKKHVFKAIGNGTATIVKCSGCAVVLQVPAKSKAVYCSFCDTVTPMELAILSNRTTDAPTLAASTTGLASAYSNDSSILSPSCSSTLSSSSTLLQRMDHQIASSVQQQELDVACAQKMALYNASHHHRRHPR